MDDVLSTAVTESDATSERADVDLEEQASTNADQSPDQSSSSPFASPSNSDNPGKRKRAADHDSDRHAAHANTFNAKYLRLLNESISELQPNSPNADRQALSSSQYGISRWSSQEKELFFRGTERYGRDNLPATATLIGTKSEPEVHVYLQLLQETSVEQHLYGNRSSLVGIVDIPAAIEVSQQCCAELEHAADALAVLQQRLEEHRERQKHPDLWKLNQKTALWVEERLHDGDEGIAEVHSELPAAEILKLGNFLKLSEQLFMNSGESDGNWRSYVSRRNLLRKESPSILYTAFEDLHRLAISLTKRLVQSSLFFAMSRLRASQSLDHPPEPAVRRCDVLAALDVLGMKHSARNAWVSVVRRCKLNVYDNDPDDAIGYDEVESILTQNKLASGVSTGSEVEDHDPPGKSSQTLSESGSNSPISLRGDYSSRERSTTPDGPLAGSELDQKEDTYLEYIDQKANWKEELDLWEILGKKPPQDLLREDSTLPQKPEPYRHNRDDMDDWRGWVDFRPEWEAYNMENLDSDLIENRKQGLRKQNISKGFAEIRRGRSRKRPSDASQIDVMSTSNRHSADDRETLEIESVPDDRSSADEDIENFQEEPSSSVDDRLPLRRRTDIQDSQSEGANEMDESDE